MHSFGNVDLQNHERDVIRSSKVKVKLFLCLTKHYAMKTCWRIKKSS